MKWFLCAAAVGLEIGCQAGPPGGSTGAGPASGTSNSSSTTSGSPSSSGGVSTGGTGTSAGSSSAGAGAGTTGSSTGGTSTGSPFVDGGYVFCALPSAADAGPNGDGGPASWMCRPGTYVCDLGGDVGNCFQCTSDADCENKDLPTYDPQRPRCDLGSGVPGYQNFCQQCLANADCAGNPAGDLCSLNPTYPPTSSAFPIELRGFESCGRLLTDCRLDGGPVCNGVDQTCDPGTGVCVMRSGACATDQDCAGFVVTPTGNFLTYFTILPEPYCVGGACNSSPDGGVCGPSPCSSDLDCGGAGLTCDTDVGQCGCRSSNSCGGIWPSCEALGSAVDDDGQTIGFCGCDQDDQCGDGLICLQPGTNTEPSVGKNGLSNGFCGIPCTSPLAAPCDSLPLGTPICNQGSGLCVQCSADQQCKAAAGAKGPRCDATLGGRGDCGCLLDSDCPAGKVCANGSFLGACELPSPSCTPATCGGSFCNWDSGICGFDLAASPEPSCLTDYDCSHDPTARTPTPFCDARGYCVGCRDNADCVASGLAALGDGFCDSAGTCTGLGCSTDADCAAKPPPDSTCLLWDAGTRSSSFCGCGSDADCVGQGTGTHCDLNLGDLDRGIFGTCSCQTGSDCPNGECITQQCSTNCASDSDCGVGNFCNVYECSPRCDPGHTCQGEAPVCDVDNLAGFNDGGVMWCYQCLQASDCDAGEGCTKYHACGACNVDSTCRSNETCLRGVCKPTCDAGPCPAGEVCDTEGIAGNGPDVCYQCVSPIDCPNGEGCNSRTHACGTCTGPNAAKSAFDCPPGSICSNYWNRDGGGSGVCLANCDAQSCPANQPLCAVLPALDLDDKFCFGCLTDYECIRADAGTWCDTSVGLTFSCQQ